MCYNINVVGISDKFVISPLLNKERVRVRFLKFYEK